MKRKNIWLVFMLVSICSLILAPSVLSASSNYTETFETDTDGTNPTESWYTYTETGWDYANASNDTGVLSSSNSYRINDTDGDQDKSIFQWTARNYTYFWFWFKIDNSSHNQTDVHLQDSNGANLICYNITGGDTLTVKSYNDAETLWTANINNNTWYRITSVFNWTDGTTEGAIGDTNIAGVYGGADTSGHLNLSDSTNMTDCYQMNITGTAVESSYIYFDNYKLSWWVATEQTTMDSLGIPTYLVVMGAVVLALLLVVFMFNQGNLDPEFIIFMTLAFVLVAVLVALLFSL